MRALFSWVVTQIATLGLVGRIGGAPGTLGSLAALPFFIYCLEGLGSLAFAITMLVLLVLGVWVCHVAEASIGKKDPGEVILDEFLAMPLCFVGLESFLEGPYRWWVLAGGFFLFRFFDIVKPLGIKSLQRIGGGFGIMLDDVVAAGYACVILHGLMGWTL